MRTPINYKEDFLLRVKMPAMTGVASGVPDFDFLVRLSSGISDFCAGRKDGELHHCRRDPDTGDLLVVCDRHGLDPCPALFCQIIYHIPDDSMSDGIRDVVREYDTGVTLVNRPLTPEELAAREAEFTAMLPYIKGEKGKPGDGRNSDAGQKIFVRGLMPLYARSGYAYHSQPGSEAGETRILKIDIYWGKNTNKARIDLSKFFYKDFNDAADHKSKSGYDPIHRIPTLETISVVYYCPDTPNCSFGYNSSSGILFVLKKSLPGIEKSTLHVVSKYNGYFAKDRNGKICPVDKSDIYFRPNPAETPESLWLRIEAPDSYDKSRFYINGIGIKNFWTRYEAGTRGRHTPPVEAKYEIQFRRSLRLWVRGKDGKRRKLRKKYWGKRMPDLRGDLKNGVVVPIHKSIVDIPAVRIRLRHWGANPPGPWVYFSRTRVISTEYDTLIKYRQF